MYVCMYVCRDDLDTAAAGGNIPGPASDADSGKELNGFFNSEYFGKFLNTCQAVSQRSCPSTGNSFLYVCMRVYITVCMIDSELQNCTYCFRYNVCMYVAQYLNTYDF